MPEGEGGLQKSGGGEGGTWRAGDQAGAWKRILDKLIRGAGEFMKDFIRMKRRKQKGIGRPIVRKGRKARRGDGCRN